VAGDRRRAEAGSQRKRTGEREEVFRCAHIVKERTAIAF
jgi:hypothetical protein